MEGVAYTGVPSPEELKNCPGVPSKARMQRGRVACIECVQEIPCNPCEGICKFGAITVGEHLPSPLLINPIRKPKRLLISHLNICRFPQREMWWML